MTYYALGKKERDEKDSLSVYRTVFYIITEKLERIELRYRNSCVKNVKGEHSRQVYSCVLESIRRNVNMRV